ncbi:MAG: hypothetical protein KF841_06395 [Phycisphaerae bacterium]|nr:hypothetical protein [Phycisphaerae bacterium]
MNFGCPPHGTAPSVDRTSGKPGEPAPDDEGILKAPPRLAVNADEGPRAIFSRPMQRLAVHFRVHLVTAPLGTFGNQSKLWSIASTPTADAGGALRQRSNGFHAAVGRDSDRPALMEYLDSIDGVKLKMDEVTPDVDKPIVVELGSIGPLSTVFHFDRRGALHGSDLIGAVARLIVKFDIRSSNLKDIWIEVVPEIEEPPLSTKWVRRPDGELIEVPEERKQTFTDMRIGAQIPEGGFLVIGGADRDRLRPVLGTVFFTEHAAEGPQSRGNDRDRIYVISPIVRFAENPISARGSP